MYHGRNLATLVNDRYFPCASDDDDEVFDTEYNWFDGLPPQEKERVKHESWTGIFDEARCPWDFVQATY